MAFYHVSKVTGKGQIHIPRQIRSSLGIQLGDKLILRAADGELHVHALNRAYFERFAGMLGKQGRAVATLQHMRSERSRYHAKKGRNR